MTKGTVQQEQNNNPKCVYTPNKRTAKYVKQNLIRLKGKIGKFTIIDTSAPLSQQVIELDGNSLSI